MIGKYMRLRILRSHSPSTQVRCLPPGTTAPKRC
jgi:hypothetical protein